MVASIPPQVPDASVVLPTYNESGSLPHVIPRIARALDDGGLSYEIIVVDDDSPDGTAEVAEALGAELPVRVIRRTTDRGLARAVIAGFHAARAPVCVVMDADGSHPVDALPGMVATIARDRADIVVGSRHVPGGGSEGWPLFSQLKSRFAAALALGVTTMTDPTTGFMAIRRELFETLKLDPVGWKIVLESVVKAAPARIAEVPIVFTDREHGESKQSVMVLMQYLQHLGRLYAHRFPALSEFVRFCIVGLLGVFVDLSTVVALKESLQLDTRLCAVGGFSLAVTTNYALNRRWTFHRGRELPVWSSYFTFVAASLLGLSIRMLTIHLLMAVPRMEQGYGYLFSNLVGIGGATIFNFVAAKYLAFDPGRLAFSEAELGEPPPPASIYPTRDARMRRSLWVPIAVGLLLAALAAGPLKTLKTDDERVNVTMARNIEGDAERFWHPSVYPGGRRDWLTEDLPALGNLPLYPTLLSVLDGIGGVAAMGLLSFLCLCVTVWSTARLAASVSPAAGLYTAALMVSSPALLSRFSLIEFEPLLTAFGSAGLLAFAHGVRHRRLDTSAVGGLLLGLAFQTKLWLIVPYVPAATACLIVQAAIARASGSGRRHRSCAAVALAAFLLTACSHLLLLAIARPADLGAWVHHVYLALFNGMGVTGAKLSAATDGSGSAWYYPSLLYREHPFLLPLCLLGLPAIVRTRSSGQTWLLATLVAGLCGLVPLSVPQAKEALYALPVLPFAYALAGLSLAAFEGSDPRFRRVDVGMIVVVCLLCAGAVGWTSLRAWLPAAVQHGDPPLWAHAGALAACALLAWVWMWRRRLMPVVLATAGTLGAIIAFVSAMP